MRKRESEKVFVSDKSERENERVCLRVCLCVCVGMSECEGKLKLECVSLFVCVMSQCVAVSLFYDCVSVNVFDCVGVGISCRFVIVILCEGERVCECACECVGVCVT